MRIMGIPPQGFAMYERMLWVQRAHSNPPCFSYLMGETLEEHDEDGAVSSSILRSQVKRSLTHLNVVAECVKLAQNPIYGPRRGVLQSAQLVRAGWVRREKRSFPTVYW